MIKKLMILVLVLILLYGIGPLLSSFSASWIAGALNCAVDEGSVHPCMMAGIDIGYPLYAMFVIGWLAMLTLPSGFLALIIWLVAALILYVLHRKRRSA